MDREVQHAEEMLRKAIRENLDNLTVEEKHDKALLPFIPTIPATEEERRDFIKVFTNPFEGKNFTEGDLRSELLYRLKNSGLNIDSELPTYQLQAVMRERIATMSPEELLKAGVFGLPFTQEDAQWVRCLIEDSMFLKKIKSN